MRRSTYIKGSRVVTFHDIEYVATSEEDFPWRYAAWNQAPDLPMPLDEKNELIFPREGGK